jgi:lambda repressor-like predicted transcriptional regulator
MPYADLPLVYLQKLAAPAHNSDIDNFTLINNTSILTRKLRHTEQLIQETTEMELHPNLNWVGRFNQSTLWKPLIHSPKERRQKAFSQHRILLSLM